MPHPFLYTPVAEILIVEDNVPYAEEVADYLAECGHQVAICATAQAMWAALQVTSAEIVLLDLKLPDTCGLPLIPQLRARFPATSILVLTALGMPDYRMQALGAGAHDYLIKPIKFPVLAQHIEALCAGKSLSGAFAAQDLPSCR